MDESGVGQIDEFRGEGGLLSGYEDAGSRMALLTHDGRQLVCEDARLAGLYKKLRAIELVELSNSENRMSAV